MALRGSKTDASPLPTAATDTSLSSDSEPIRAAMSRSRSSRRRPKVASPTPLTAAVPEPKIPTPRYPSRVTSGSSGFGHESPRPKTGDRPVTCSSPTSEGEYLLPAEAMIPGSTRVRIFTASEVAPWSVDLVNTWSLVTMTPDDLGDRLELPWGWFGPPDGCLDRPARWKTSLVTPSMVMGLLASQHWVVVKVALPPVSFRLEGWFADLAGAYSKFENEHSQALWEATHCLWISKDQARASSFLASYYNARKKRRSRATLAWREILNRIFEGMVAHRCDLDILLDPFFRHLPRARRVVYWFPGCEEGSDPVDLLAALQISDSTWPWLSQYRLTSEPHPGTKVARLQNKFVPPS